MIDPASNATRREIEVSDPPEELLALIDEVPQNRISEEQALADGENFYRNAWEAFKFTWPFMRPYYSFTLLVGLCDFGLVLLNLVPPWMGKFLIDSAFPQRNWDMAWQLVIGSVAVLFFIQGITAMRAFLWGYQEVRLPIDLRNRVYRHLQRLSLDTTEARPVGQQIFRTTVDCDRLAATLTRIVPHAFYLAEFILLVAFASYVDPLITGIVLLFLIPWTILFWWVTSIGRMLDRRRLWLAEMRDSGTQQGVSTFALIKSFGRIRHETRKYGKRSVAVQRMGAIGYLILVFFEFVTQKILPYAKTVTIFLYFSFKVVVGDMTLGMTVPMTAYLTRLNYPLERIVNFGNWIRQIMISAERIMQILQVEPAVKDIPNARRLRSFSGLVTFENVSFERPGVGQILKGISATLEPGTTTAIVGPSGAGKSTLVSMLLRLIQPKGGRVMVDGIDLRAVKLESYLQQVGIVVQETFIFGGSLADNMRLACPDATDEAMERALNMAGLTPWFKTLPDGLDTDLLDGTALSVGQKQRVGIARALLTDAPLIVLDEPTSALDATTEREVMETIRGVTKDKTVLLVTHRLDTIVYADTILVLDAGEVVQRGTHNDLMKEGGLYAELRRAYHQEQTRELAEVTVS